MKLSHLGSSSRFDEASRRESSKPRGLSLRGTDEYDRSARRADRVNVNLLDDLAQAASADIYQLPLIPTYIDRKRESTLICVLKLGT